MNEGLISTKENFVKQKLLEKLVFGWTNGIGNDEFEYAIVCSLIYFSAEKAFFKNIFRHKQKFLNQNDEISCQKTR